VVIVVAGSLSVAVVLFPRSRLDFERISFDPLPSVSDSPAPFVDSLSVAIAVLISALFLSYFS
jgi:hypothetical protein